MAPAFAIKVDRSLGILGVLVEPASIVAKAWDQIDRMDGASDRGGLAGCSSPARAQSGCSRRSWAAQRGFDVDVLDCNVHGVKPRLVCDLGARYHADPASAVSELAADVILECTGAPQVIAAVLAAQAPSGVVRLLGLGPDHNIAFDIGRFNRALVLGNDVVFGSVNANRRHYEMAADALMRADRRWLGRLISRRVPLARWREALDPREGDIKVVIDFAA